MFNKIALGMGLMGWAMVFANVTHAADPEAAQVYKFKFTTDKPLVSP